MKRLGNPRDRSVGDWDGEGEDEGAFPRKMITAGEKPALGW